VKIGLKKSKTIKHKLLKQFLFVALIPIMLLIFALMFITYILSGNQAADQLMHNVTSAQMEMSNKITYIHNLLDSLPQTNATSGIFSADSLYSLITDNITEQHIFDVHKLPNYWRIRSTIINSHLINNKYINGIYVLMSNGNALSFSQHHFFPNDYPYTEALWYNIIANTESRHVVMEQGISHVFQHSSVDSAITFARPLVNFTTMEKIGIILIDCNSLFFEPLSGLTTPEGASVTMMNRETVWYDSSNGMLNEHLHLFISGSNEASGISRNVAGHQIVAWREFAMPDDLVIISALSIPFLSSQYFGFAAIGSVISLLAIAVAIIASALTSRSFTKPIISLVANMDSSSSKLPNPAERYEGEDELLLLYKQYNNMIDAIDTYINENYAYKLSLAESKMSALEAQIDTHFLYNTLECIYSMALIEDADNTANITKSLGDMFRYVTLATTTTVVLRSEMIYTHNYFTILKARYEDRLDFSISIPDELYEIQVLRLLIQPLVENSMKYGFGYKKEVHQIHISAEKCDDFFTLIVKDNGIGMRESRLNEVISYLTKTGSHESSSGIGLKNIYYRLCLCYGDEANLTISSTYGEGTSVIVVMPIHSTTELPGKR